MVRFRCLSLVAMTCAPIAPRFLIPSLVFLILGIDIQASARRRRTFYTGDKVCLFNRCLLYIRRGHIPLATRSGLTGRVGSARSCESHTIKHTRDICSCSAEELLVPSRQRVVVGAGIMLLGLRPVWHDTHHGGAKRGLRRVKSL